MQPSTKKQKQTAKVENAKRNINFENIEVSNPREFVHENTSGGANRIWFSGVGPRGFIWIASHIDGLINQEGPRHKYAATIANYQHTLQSLTSVLDGV